MDKMDLEFYEHFCDKLDDIACMLDRIYNRIDAMANDEARQAELKYQLRFADECLFCEASVSEEEEINCAALYADGCLFCEASVEE